MHEPDEHDADLLDDGDDAGQTVACPECGDAVYAGADRCPSCGHWFTLEQATHQPRSWWKPVVIALIVAMLVILVVLF